MGSNLIRRSGADQNTKADGKNSGMTVDPGPYEAVVVRHVEGTRMGQLEVYIPDMGGTYDPKADGIVVSYASPFYGTTYGTDKQSLPDTAATAGQSYGMWMIPPDIGCKVLVIFVAGDMSRGYWFACVYDTPSHHMVPAIGRAIGGKDKTKPASDALKSKVSSESVLPVIEYTTGDTGAFKNDALTNTPRNPHELQASILINQGLDKDPIRGAISSSSLRESPSNVYGISTPGRKATPSGQVPGKDQAVIYRRGGHQFVMDDGSEKGEDQLIRLRTSGGHQILMNDSEQILYVASSSGKQWLEFSASGQINVYADTGFNLRTKGTLNLHSDKKVNIQGDSVHISASGSGITLDTPGKIKLSALASTTIVSNGPLTLHTMAVGSFAAAGSLSVSSDGEVSLDGSKLKLNGGGGGAPTPATPPELIPKDYKDVKLVKDVWGESEDEIESICTVTPTHEPWGKNGKRPKK